jgi:NAD(P)-dependent dehydrogenase (short-subunit alcohol dehydrogenase family)
VGHLFVLGGATGGLGKQVVRISSAAGVGRSWCDLNNQESVTNWCASLSALDGEIHILNLAGKMSSGMLHKASLLDWQLMLDTNVAGNALALSRLRAVFKSHPGSTYTMVGSVTAELGVIGTGLYSATKSALEGLTRVAAHEFAPFARVNLLHLGYCNAGMIAAVPNHEELIESIPLKRLGTAEDVAEAWKFFINCQYVTGAIVNVNGGLV